MKGLKDFFREEEGVAIIEIVLILVILIGLVVVFKNKITTLNNKILTRITTESNKILWKSDNIFCFKSAADLIVSACTIRGGEGIRIKDDGHPRGRNRDGLCCSRISACVVE